MAAPPIPAAVFDERRLEAVRATGLLDTGPEEPFDRLARVASRVLGAPYAFVTIVDERRSYWKSCIGVQAGTPSERQNPVAESFCQYVIGSGAAVLVDDAANDERTRENPSIAKMGVASWAGVPVVAPDGEILGTFCCVDTKPRRWSADDLLVLQALSDAASGEIALRAAAVRSAALAHTLQQGLLPPTLPAVASLDIAARYRPAAGGNLVVGDFYDFFQRAEDSWVAVVGDVCGKGVEAAQLSFLARHTIHAAAITTRRPHLALGALHRALLAADETGVRFVTAIYALLRAHGDSFDLSLCNAGHPPALVRRADGSLGEIGTRGLLLGTFVDPWLSDANTRLAPGDALILYTDGITEGRADGAMFGEERLRRLILSDAWGTAADLVGLVDAAVLEFSGGALADDAAILVVRIP